MGIQPGLIWGLFTIWQIVCTRRQTICTIQHVQYSKPCAQYSKPCAQDCKLYAQDSKPCAQNGKPYAQYSKPHPLSEHLRETPTSYASASLGVYMIKVRHTMRKDMRSERRL